MFGEERLNVILFSFAVNDLLNLRRLFLWAFHVSSFRFFVTTLFKFYFDLFSKFFSN